jgi:predicted PurR-regulated permease PerM
MTEPKTENLKRVVRFELAPMTMITLVLVLAGLWLLFKLLPVLLVLVAAFFAVGTLNPLVHWIEGKGYGRGLSIGIVFGSLMIGTLAVAILTIPALLTQASSILDQEPALRAQLADRLSGFPLSDALAKWLRDLKYGGSVNATGSRIFTYSMEALKFLAFLFSAISLALYIMVDRDRLKGGLFAVIPRSHHIRLSRVLMKLETIVGAYIRGQAITSLSIGALILVLMVSCGVENAMALAVFGALADILPYIGVLLPTAVVVLSTAPHGPGLTMVVLSLMVLYMGFESRVLVPKVYGQALRLPSTVIFISLLAGGILMGIGGALLSLPFAAAAIMLIEELRLQLPGQQEQASDGAQRVEDDRGEQEFERRSEGVTAERSAAIATEISGDRVKEDNRSMDEMKRGKDGNQGI